MSSGERSASATPRTAGGVGAPSPAEGTVGPSRPAPASHAVALGAHRFSVALRVLQTLAVLGVVFGAATIRVIVAGEREIAASTAALRAGDAKEATVCARRAAGWYAPGAPHVRAAYDRLIALGVAAEGLGDRELSLLAWRGIRTAVLETRWVMTPHEADLTRANEAIARISADAPRPPGTRTEPARAIEREHWEALTRDDAPRVPWVIALVAAFAVWVSGLVLVTRRAITGTGHIEWRRARAGILVAATGAAVWLLALWRA